MIVWVLLILLPIGNHQLPYYISTYTTEEVCNKAKEKIDSENRTDAQCVKQHLLDHPEFEQ